MLIKLLLLGKLEAALVQPGAFALSCAQSFSAGGGGCTIEIFKAWSLPEAVIVVKMDGYRAPNKSEVRCITQLDWSTRQVWLLGVMITYYYL